MFIRRLKNTGEHVLITGGTSGIGLELSKQFILQGSKVTVVGRNPEKLETAVETLSQLSSSIGGRKPFGQTCNVANAAACEELFIVSELEQGPVSLLICCAGSAMPGYFESLNPETFEEQIRSNYLSAVYPAQAAFRRMKQRRKGHIVFTSSLAGLVGIFGFAAYSASKFAIRGLAEVLYQECLPYDIGVSVVFPPDTKTPGLEEENKHKPRETVLLSQGAGLFSAHQVAEETLKGILERKFFITVGFEGNMVALVCSGFGPQVSVVQILLMPFIRASCFFFRKHQEYIIKAESKRRLEEPRDSS
eukprot:jgi/Galph1/5775/GphlegSOOS_G4418.1